MVYAYAIADSPRPDVAGQHGLADAPLDVRPVGRLAAIFTVHEGPAPKPTAENVWRHEQVVERIMADHAVLPARFGTTFSDPAKLETVLARHQDRLAEGLGRVRGCVELGLRVLWQPRAGAANQIPAESGRAYMTTKLAEEQRRREELRRAELVAEEMHVPLAGIASENTRRVLARPEVPLTAAYLVPRAKLDAFRAAVERLGAARPDLRLLCTGPWPPYHFVPSILDDPEAKRA